MPKAIQAFDPGPNEHAVLCAACARVCAPTQHVSKEPLRFRRGRAPHEGVQDAPLGADGRLPPRRVHPRARGGGGAEHLPPRLFRGSFFVGPRPKVQHPRVERERAGLVALALSVMRLAYAFGRFI